MMKTIFMDTSKQLSVEEGIEMPKITKQGVKKYPFDKMKVGDSFLFAHDYENNTIAAQRMGAIAATWASKHHPKRKFSLRTINGKIRVWRVK